MGAKVTVMFNFWRECTLPKEGLPLKPVGYTMLLTCKVALPLLEMVIVRCAEVPSATSPKFKLPLTEKIFAALATGAESARRAKTANDLMMNQIFLAQFRSRSLLPL